MNCGAPYAALISAEKLLSDLDILSLVIHFFVFKGETRMSYAATNAKVYEGTSVDDGQCVAFVRAASAAPPTFLWKRGEQIKFANNISYGTAIATFDSNGKYGSRKDGTCHAAIFLRKTAAGIVVLDQWITNGKRQSVHERTIRFGNSIGKKINNGDEYYVVE